MVVRIASAQVEIEEAIAVDVSEIRTHRQHRKGQPLLLRDIRECPVAQVAVHARRLEVDGLAAEIVGGEFIHATRIARDEQVQRTIVVEVPEPRRETRDRLGETQMWRDVRESAVAIVHVEAIRPHVVGHVELGETITVDVTPGHAFCIAEILHAGFGSDIGECRVAVISEQLAGRLHVVRVLVSDENIEVAIIVVVEPGGGLRRIVHIAEPGPERDVSERAVSVVAHE